MGYVPLFCCACAGPIDHGFGLDGALADAAEASAEDPAGADAQRWGLPVNEMRWLEALRVLLPPHGEKDGGTSGTLAYEDFGLVHTDGDSIALNPIAWSMDVVDGCRPGVACHHDCLVLLERHLASRGTPVLPSEFAAAYYRAIDAQWTALQQRQQRQQQQQPDAAHEDLLLNTLLPGVDYGQGVLDKCDQFYEFLPGFEWLVVSPSAAGEGGDNGDATRNRERIEEAIAQLLNQLGLD